MTEITKYELMRYKESGLWRKLESLANDIIQDVEAGTGATISARLGGGTRLMLSLNHRISRDIDLFITNPQFVGYISPRLNEKLEDIVSDYEEAPDFIKLKFTEGEIDFIVRGSLLRLPDEHSPETSFVLEPIAEVLAKKLFYRGPLLTPRDLFDWWAIDQYAPEVVPAKEMGNLLKKREKWIVNALTMLAVSDNARSNWDSIVAPEKPGIDDAIDWAKKELKRYMVAAQGPDQSNDSEPPIDDDSFSP